MTLSSSISTLKGLTKRHRAALRAMGIETVKDLIFYFPFRYDDFTRTISVAEARPDTQATLVARVAAVKSRRSFRRRIAMTEAVLEDGTGRLTALWFHQPYVANRLRTGVRYRFAGKITMTKYGLRLVNPEFEACLEEISTGTRTLGGSKDPGSLVPVYSVSLGMARRTLRRLFLACKPLFSAVPDNLPEAIRRRYGLLPLSDALSGIHFPAAAAERDAARRRLGFDEILTLEIAVGRTRSLREGRKAPPVPFDEQATRSFVGRLPFALTGDQRRAAWDALRDMGRPIPMHRLLDGDVGSGKTVVAAIAMVNAAKAGFQCALMAPTEILARQHFETLKAIMSDEPFGMALWTNSYKRSARVGAEIICGTKAEAARLGGAIAEGGIGIVVGTHALVEDTLRFRSLALAVIDEQHRFGVRTRQLLCRKSGMAGVEPHLLSMTATPIPRSLALTVFGDLDLSLLKEKPKDRKAVITKIIAKTRRPATYGFVRGEIAAGRQAFIVCPVIDESDARRGAAEPARSRAAVTEVYERLRSTEFREIPMGMLHGKMPAGEKERVMRDFLDRRIMILVSTSVIEVGVDVPNATVMCVEGAERFGLAQLHQFRGRVGRGSHQSHCFLFPSASLRTSPSEGAVSAEARLKAMETTSDGFTLAERDLALRGPGDLLGEAQSGYPAFKIASLADICLIGEAKEAAAAILEKGGGRENSALSALIAGAADSAHLE